MNNIVFVFYKIENVIYLNKFQLLQPSVESGYYYVTSNFILNYYSNDFQRQIGKLSEKDLIKVLEHEPEDLSKFIQFNIDRYGISINKALLMQIHLCITYNLIFVISDEEFTPLIKEIANTYSVDVCSIQDFFTNKIRKEKYYDLLVEINNNK